MSSRHLLAIHTVFLARENIAYLKEWILYHALLGVQHFYLYDNTGSIGRDGSNSTTNKYGIDFFELTKNLTDADVADQVDKIIADRSVDVTLIKWQPRDGLGRIYYGYNESVYHCIRTYGRQTEWISPSFPWEQAPTVGTRHSTANDDSAARVRRRHLICLLSPDTLNLTGE